MKFFTALLLVTLSMVAVGQTWVTNPANGHRYTIIQAQIPTWENSETLAISHRGHLACISDVLESRWILENIVDPWAYSRTDPYEWTPWIGLYQQGDSQEPDGGWYWVTGEPLSFTDWLPGEPNNGGAGGNENFGEFNSSRHYSTHGTRPGGWNDMGWDGQSRVGIVEVVPEPTTMAMLGLGLATLIVKRRRS